MSDYIFKIFDFPEDPISLLDVFKEEPFVFFLDSGRPSPEPRRSRAGTFQGWQDPMLGRFSFIGFDPFEILQQQGKDSLVALKKRFFHYAHPHSRLSREKSPTPLGSGIIGYLSYDLGLRWENIPLQIKKKDPVIPDSFFGFYDCILTIDHFQKKLIVTSSGLPERNPNLRRKRAQSRLEGIIGRLKRYPPRPAKSLDISGRPSRGEPIPSPLNSNFTRHDYGKAIKRILEYIRQGDVYQVNLSQRFEWNPSGRFNPVKLYRRLRGISPCPFGSLLHCGSFQILSNSPERFIKLEGRRLQTRPMKGTRPRGETAEEDRKKKRELLISPKDRAELLMITDLERNDLGRVCEYGSIKVKAMRTLEAYQTVFQATSTVEGQLKKDKDGFDVLRSCFPGGSVTGCPKIRAMEIIEELEPTRRGIYTGSLGYMSFSGNMDFNILIRTLLNHGKRIYSQTGGGIVADSRPDEEYQETLVKARALRLCLSEIKEV